jgi:predicted nucleic acid-binding OB-fold protein
LIDADLPEKSIAVSSLMEYISSDISRSKLLTVKSRLLKAIGLTEIGFINEAYQLYNRILSLKDLPKIGARDSDFLVKKEGKNFYFPYN